MEPIYLDHNATAPILPAVADAVRDALLAFPGNASSQHGPGRDARRRLEADRERVAAMLGVDTAGPRPDRLIFTSGGTESNNLALRGVVEPLLRAGRPARLIVSAVEHPSVMETASRLRERGCRVDLLPVDHEGVVRLDTLDALLAEPAGESETLVSVMLGNNETGVLQPIEEIARRSREAGALSHTDAVQALGKAPVDFRRLGVSMLSLTAHKLHGPVGVGGLLVESGLKTPELLSGGWSNDRPGTSPVALVAGLAAALEAAHNDAGRPARMRGLRDRFESLVTAADPQAVVVGAGAARLPHVANIAFVGLDRQVMHMALDREAIACSTGSACASGSSEPSPVLTAMGVDNRVVGGSLRFSLGALTTEREVDEAARRISLVCKRLRGCESGRK
ncbi:Cysteine desulfurase [Pseudobythopirellula maris]|uniref:Cysteine desulfurase n=1 Tax=Pseudobythopirellula maris TaxID=2527991 RepID=A0A5C5ZQH5_9BACT|nr:cysteine desulfurase family protein [Pseudobythopirellula maris]TWT89081.1 Cysteine desulfurase [Pseudobythopirellula maris]